MCRFVLTVALAFLAAASAPATDAPLTVGPIEIVVRDIFSPHEVADAAAPLRILRGTMNHLHANTRERVIRRELLFRQGEVFTPALLEQTARNLRALGFLNDVSVAAVDTAADGSVAVRVSVRESWTLSTSATFTLASGGNARWNVSMAERNFLGTGVTVGAGAGADEDRSWWNAWYRKRRLFGRPLWFGIDWAEQDDGHSRGVFLRRPFYALDDARGLDFDASDREAERRWFLSNAGAAGIDPAASASLYARIAEQRRQVSAQGLWRVSPRGRGRIWRVGGGVVVSERRWRLAPAYALSDGRAADLSWLEADDGPMAAETGVRVFPFAAVASVGRRWTEARYVLQYGPVEDLPCDLSFDLKAGPAGGAVGSTTGGGEAALRAEGALVKWWVRGRSHVLLQAGGYGQAGSAAVRQHAVQAAAGWIGQAGAAATPWLGRVFVEAAHGSGLTGSDAFVLGLERGLRTLEYDGMAGDRLARWNVEAGKVTPHELLGLARLGAAVFYGGGVAWWRDEDRGLADARHEVGFGLRLGPTRSVNTQVTRIDLTWALDGSAGPVLTAVTRGMF